MSKYVRISHVIASELQGLKQNERVDPYFKELPFSKHHFATGLEV